MTFPGADTMKAGIMGEEALRSAFLAPLPLVCRRFAPLRVPFAVVAMTCGAQTMPVVSLSVVGSDVSVLVTYNSEAAWRRAEYHRGGLW